jgi:hypothetical protein
VPVDIPTHALQTSGACCSRLSESKSKSKSKRESKSESKSESTRGAQPGVGSARCARGALQDLEEEEEEEEEESLFKADAVNEEDSERDRAEEEEEEEGGGGRRRSVHAFKMDDAFSCKLTLVNWAATKVVLCSACSNVFH